MKGLKKVATDSKALRGFYGGEYLQLFYNKNTDTVFTHYHYNLGHGTYTVIDDTDVVNCGNIYDKSSMADIKDMINIALAKYNIYC